MPSIEAVELDAANVAASSLEQRVVFFPHFLRPETMSSQHAEVLR